MANTLKIKRGTAATIPQGQLAEPLFTTDTYDLYIGKGAGGNQRIQNYIASGTSSQFLKGDGSLDSTTYQTALTFTSPLVNTSGTVSIPAATSSVNGYLTSTDWTTFNSKEPAITAGTTLQYYRGDKTFQTLDTAAVPENGAIYFTEPRVRATVLTGLNLSGGGTISASDSVLTAFGKVQNQISALVGGATYQGTWNANTNTPTLASGTGTKGYYYVVSVAGSTNLDGITDWKVGDWAIFNGTTWDKVDNTDAVSSVNGFTGAVNLALDNISDVSAASPTNAQLLRFNGTSSLWENWTPTFEPALTKGNLTETTSSVLTITGGTGAVIGSGTTIAVAQSSGSTSGYLSSTDWTTFNNKQNALTNPVTGTGTNNEIAYFNTTGSTIASLSTATYPSLTELSYVKGVTSAIQTQLNAKEPTVTKGNLTETTSSVLTITGGTGAVIGSGTTIAVASAGASQAGVVTTGTQTFAGNKTFAKSILVGGGSDGEYALTLGEGRSGNGFSYVDLVGDATYTDYGLRLIRSNGGANTDSSLIHRGTGSLVIETTDGGAIKFRNSAGTDAATISSGNLTLNNGGDLIITASTSGSNTTLYNDTGTLIITTPISGTSATFSGSGNILTVSTSSTSVNGQIKINNSTSGDLYLGVAASDGTSVFTGTTAYSGYVGTNTNTPLYLVTNGTARVTISSTGAATFSSSISATSATFNVGSATTVLGLTGNGNGATIASITNTDIGSSARSSFQVTSDSATAHYFASSSTNVSSATGGRASTAGIFTASGDTAGGLAFLARNAAGVITFHAGGNTERMRITSGGNVQISSDSGYGSGGGQLQINKDASSTPPTLTLFGWNNLSVDQAAGVINFSVQTTGTAGQVASSIRGLNGDIGESSGILAFYTTSNTTTPAGSAGTERMRITSGGNVGIGVTPSAWNGVSNVLQVGSSNITSSFFNSGTDGMHLASNAFFDTSTYKYIANGTATIFRSAQGEFRWLQAPSGTAGNAITFTQAMTLTSGGEVLINTTTDSGNYKLQVNGNIYAGGGGDLVLSPASSGGNASLYNDNGYFQMDTRLLLNGSIKTSNPNGGTAAEWKLGSRLSGTVSTSTTNYLEIDINGTLYYLAFAVPL